MTSWLLLQVWNSKPTSKEWKKHGLILFILSLPVSIILPGKQMLPNHTDFYTTSMEDKPFSTFLLILSTLKLKITISSLPKLYGIEVHQLADSVGLILDWQSSMQMILSVNSMNEVTNSSNKNVRNKTLMFNTDWNWSKSKRTLKLLFSKLKLEKQLKDHTILSILCWKQNQTKFWLMLDWLLRMDFWMSTIKLYNTENSQMCLDSAMLLICQRPKPSGVVSINSMSSETMWKDKSMDSVLMPNTMVWVKPKCTWEWKK